jgi:RNA polymerase sigma factor (sigma-70 family)
MVYGVCLRELGDPDDAADATQATFILLQNSAKHIRRTERVAAWLYSAARHVCQNARRERARRLRVEGASLMDSLQVPQPLPSSDRPEAAQILTLLSALPEKDRLALSLRYFNGMSVKEVGSALGIAEQAAQMRLTRALERLRKRLGAFGLMIPVGEIHHTLQQCISPDAPTVDVRRGAEHRWATRMRTKPGRILMRFAGYSAAGIGGLAVFGPVLGMMAFGQVPPNLGGAMKVWHEMDAGITGAGRVQVLEGTWESHVGAVELTDSGPTDASKGVKVVDVVRVFRSPNNENIELEMDSSHALGESKGRPHSAQMSFQHTGDQWVLNGNKAVASGDKDFRWDQGHLVLTADTDRSTERLTIDANGSKLKVLHEQGGSVRSLTVRDSYDVTRTSDDQFDFPTGP